MRAMWPPFGGGSTNLAFRPWTTFTGFPPDLHGPFKALEVVCVPSRNEAFGLTVIEAMAAGKAVIGSDSGAIPELLERECGRLAPPEDAEAWAAAMAELAGDAELRRRLGQAARRRVEEDFTLAAHVAGLIRDYENQQGAEGE